VVSVDAKGKATQDEDKHTVSLKETLTKGEASICKGGPKCTGTTLPGHPFPDGMIVNKGKGHTVEKRFTIDGHPARVYDPTQHKIFDYVRVVASMKSGFDYTFHNNSEQNQPD
jgi:hypothetical protein